MRLVDEKQVLEEARYILAHPSTTRIVADHFQVSPATLWRHLSINLKEIDPVMWEQVRNILMNNRPYSRDLPMDIVHVRIYNKHR